MIDITEDYQLEFDENREIFFKKKKEKEDVKK